MTNFDFFLVYYRHMINSGVRQIDIHKSDKVNVSIAYINKLYKNPPKSCSLEIQTEIARYFGLSYDQMIEEGKKLYRESQENLSRIADDLQETSVPPEEPDSEPIEQVEPVQTIEPKESSNTAVNSYESRSYNPIHLIDKLNFVATGIRQNHEKLADLENERDELQALLNVLNTGICVADDNLTISYQNPQHKKMFGNRTGERYALFWNKAIREIDLIEKLTAGEYDTTFVSHNGNSYIVQISVKYKGNVVQRIIENVVSLEKQASSLRALDKKMKIYTQVFKQLDHGFGFFNKDRKLELASNKFGLIDPKYDFPNQQPTVDQLLLDLSDKISGGLEKLSLLKKAYEDKEEINIEIQIGHDQFNFQTQNIMDEDAFEGVLLIVRKI